MTLHRHELAGCAPEPLAWYLKALGILRVVSEQADPAARGWWQDERFWLVTQMDAPALERFLLDAYRPAALVAPWNRGSGFVFPNNNPNLALIRATTAERFAPFRAAIDAAGQLTAELKAADEAVRALKDQTKKKPGMSKAQVERARGLKQDPSYKRQLAAAERAFKAVKDGLIPRCRLKWTASQLEWLEAAVVVDQDGDARFPALLGTGGNDGKNDFTKWFMGSLARVFDLSSTEAGPQHGSAELLVGSLWGTPVRGQQAGLPVGQFLPGGAGGANSNNGPAGESSANPWDYLLMMEGVLAFSSAFTRRSDVERGGVAAPFAMRSCAAGYGSAAPSDEGPRGEQWMPLWTAPATIAEIKQLLAEGRAQVGRRPGERATDVSRAVARLGVARGIAAFQRFGFIERNGQANLATPLGRFVVVERPALDVLGDLDGWHRSLRIAVADDHSPRSLKDAVQVLDEVMLAVCRDPCRQRWQAILFACATLESRLAASTAFTAKRRLSPIPPLSSAWLAACDDGSAEFRLALALATAAQDEKGKDPIRRHWLPVDRSQRRFATEGGQDHPRLAKDPRVVASGLDLIRDSAAVVRRRLIERGAGHVGLPLEAARGCAASAEDLAALVDQQVDEERILMLARAFMALKRREWRRPRIACALAGEVQPVHALIRIAHLPWPLPLRGGDVTIRTDPAIIARLMADDLAGAVQLARRRVIAAGLRPAVTAAFAEPGLAVRLAASLAFPIEKATAVRLARYALVQSPE